MPNYLFFDCNKDIVRAFKIVLGKLQSKTNSTNNNFSFSFWTGDVRQLINHVDVFVSPANSHGYMDGGIDQIYMDMFPGIEKVVQKDINNNSKAISQQTGKPILPVGAAIITQIPGYENKRLVCAPTMEVPHAIWKHPENIYYAMIAIITVCQQYGDHIVVAVPGLGTGVGGISAHDCAVQVYKAFDDLLNDRVRYPEGLSFILPKKINDPFLIWPTFLY